ncbi:hypothetical protein Tco_1521851 [Tanacetum coccineum]
MADNTDLTPLSLKKENVTPVNSKIAELSESRAELLNRIQNLKNDLQSWRSKLDTQVKSYRDVSVTYVNFMIHLFEGFRRDIYCKLIVVYVEMAKGIDTICIK